jgi:hypothetical protein
MKVSCLRLPLRGNLSVVRIALPILALLGSGAFAAPNEIKVFTDEIAPEGKYTVETHVNAVRAPRPPISGFQRLQVMPEISYGVRPNWEASLQLPMASSTDGWRGNGVRGELQYVAPHSDGSGAYWGVNLEIAYLSRLAEAAYWNIELVPILGYRWREWHISVNPAVNRALTGQQRQVLFEPALKVSRAVANSHQLGIEYYAETGPLRNWLPPSERYRVLYAAWDFRYRDVDINLGFGKGIGAASDRNVLKAIVELPF